MQRLVVGLCVLALLVVGIPAFAQTGNSIVGTWETVSTKQDGKEVPQSSEGAPAGVKPGISHYIYTADGHYTFLRFSTGRPNVTTPLNQRSKEELLSQYWGVAGQYGTYSASGGKLTRRCLAAMSPANEGKDFVFTFRFDGADLIITSTGTGPKTETRYRRAK
jgi:hypothetical protein